MSTFDTIVIGAGPIGSAAALAFAARGASVLLLEAAPSAKERFAGEWLHPRAVTMLASLGVALVDPPSVPARRGFVVLPDDGSEPIVLPYVHDGAAFAAEHSALVDAVRDAAAAHPRVRYVAEARALDIAPGRVRWQTRGVSGDELAHAALVIGADGRASAARRALGLPELGSTYSRMAGLLLRGVELPFEGLGHVVLGGAGPALLYRVGPNTVRACLDVPLSAPSGAERAAYLWDAFSTVLPRALLPAVRTELREGRVAWAANQLRPRGAYGVPGLALVGDAAGHYHPLTALGMTLGLVDVERLAATGGDVAAYQRTRLAEGRVPELLALALYEAFADPAPEMVLMREAIYDVWRRQPRERARTMRFLAVEDTSLPSFADAFLRVTTRAAAKHVARSATAGRLGEARDVLLRLADRVRWLARGALRHDWRGTSVTGDEAPIEVSWPVARNPSVAPLPAAAARDVPSSPARALVRGVEQLAALQRDDGSFEGEVTWCPMLAAQYVLFCRATQTPIAPRRAAGLVGHFAATRDGAGLWGLHEKSEPYLFTTTLVYVAARLLGVAATAPLLARAHAFIRREGVIAIPTWGKLWLAVVGLYDWRGVAPVVPEAWALPSFVPLHPSHFYCHTRVIYAAMAVLFAGRRAAPPGADLDAIRGELWPDYASVDWTEARSALRASDLHAAPSRALRVAYRALALFDQVHSRRVRARLTEKLRGELRYSLRTTAHASISPVSGLLELLALHGASGNDADFRAGLAGLERWIWEDAGTTRVAGARSVTWDTAFAAQALAAAKDAGAAPSTSSSAALARAHAFLVGEQLRDAPPDYGAHHRDDPRGGFCFSPSWQGWPVSDCTAEALLALLSAPDAIDESGAVAAVRFISRCQNRDGGFGSYEARRTRVPLEWLNPAEMFGDSMSETSYVECTASSLCALAAARARWPWLAAEVDDALARATTFLRRAQRPDGSFAGAWGVSFIYGTMFGVRGLLAAGVPPHDPAIRRAASWLLARQRQDGGFGEHHHATRAGTYVEHYESQVVQTAWALTTLLEARSPDFAALERAAAWLASRQRADGTWPREDAVGVFFRTALLDYTLYRAYFPVWALALYERRRGERLTGGGTDALRAAG